MKDMDIAQKKITDEVWHERAEITNASELAHDAQYAAETERQMTLWQGLKAYPKAAGWSIVISIATTMDGYDTGFLTSLFGLVSLLFCLIQSFVSDAKLLR